MRGGKIFTYFDTRVNTLSSLSSRICLSYCAKEFNDRKNSNFLIEACEYKKQFCIFLHFVVLNS